MEYLSWWANGLRCRTKAIAVKWIPLVIVSALKLLCTWADFALAFGLIPKFTGSTSLGCALANAGSNILTHACRTPNLLALALTSYIVQKGYRGIAFGRCYASASTSRISLPR
jgi:hypothetical protein